MEAKTSLVRTDGAVELYAVSVVYLNLSLVIYPGNTEHDDTLRSGQTLQKSISTISFLVGFNHYAERFENLFNGLVKFRLGGILCYYSFNGFIYIRHFLFLLYRAKAPCHIIAEDLENDKKTFCMTVIQI